MSGTSPVFVRQLLPAVAIVAIGAFVMSQVSPPGGTSATAELGETPVNAEAVFTSTPRPASEETKSAAAPRVVHKPKPVASNAALPRKPETAPVQQAAAGAPLSIAPSPEQIQAMAGTNDTSIMGTLRNVGSTVTELPQRAYSKMTGWFSSDAPSPPNIPPRPPAEIPQAKAEM